SLPVASDHPRFPVRLRIIDGHRVLEVVAASGQSDTFDQVQLVAARQPGRVIGPRDDRAGNITIEWPGAPIAADRIDDQGVALPPPDRMAHECREQFVCWWMTPAVHVDSSRLCDRFMVDRDHVRSLQYLDREQVAPVHEHDWRPRIALARG